MDSEIYCNNSNEKCLIKENTFGYFIIVLLLTSAVIIPIFLYRNNLVTTDKLNDNYIDRDFLFALDYENYETVRFSFSNKNYTYYKELPHPTFYISTPEMDAEIMTDYVDYKSVSVYSNYIKNRVTHYNNSDELIINGLLKFAQAKDSNSFSPQYIDDINGEDYAKYPIETLSEGNGDCEDLSILLASLVRSLNYKCRLFLTWNETNAHVLPIIHIDNSPTYDSEGLYSYVDIGGDKYYFAETTNFSFKLGQFPSILVGWNYTISNEI